MQPITMPAMSPPAKLTPPLAAANMLEITKVAEACEPDDEVADSEVSPIHPYRNQAPSPLFRCPWGEDY